MGAGAGSGAGEGGGICSGAGRVWVGSLAGAGADFGTLVADFSEIRVSRRVGAGGVEGG